MGKQYKITLTEEQIAIVERYVEITMRLFMGQDWMFTDKLAGLNFDLSPKNPHHKAIFDKYIRNRDHIREIMKAAYRIAFEPYGYLEHKTDEMLEAETIWDAIRTARGVNRWGKAYQIGHEPIPEIEVIEDDQSRECRSA